MKKNLLLVAVLSGLILFAFFWEQKGLKEHFVSKERGELIFNVDSKNLVELTLKNAKVFNKNGRWTIGELNYPADERKINYIMSTLKGISSISKIIDNKNTEEFFIHQNHSFRVKTYKGEIGFRLGDISPVTGYFYIEKFENGKKDLFLAKDLNPYDGIYKNDLEADFRKYLAFKNIITMGAMELISQELIPGLKVVDIVKLVVDNKANRWFEVNFLEEVTNPKAYEGLRYKPAYKKMNQLWGNVKVKKVVPLSNNILSEQLSKVELHTKDSKYELVLYGEFNGANGYYATVKGQDKVFVIDEASKDFFFANVQDFWEKTVDYKTDFSKIKKFSFTLGSKSQQYKFKVEDIEKFEVSIDDNRLKGVRAYNINLLFNLVLNLVEFKEAKYVSQAFTRIEKEDVALYMSLFNKKLVIIFKENSITVRDLSDKVEYFYPHKISSINVKGLGDFFTLK